MAALLPLLSISQKRHVKGLESLMHMADTANPHLRESLREQELSDAQWHFAREWWLPELSAGVRAHQLGGAAMNGNGNFYLDVSRDNLWMGPGLEAKWNVLSGKTTVQRADLAREAAGFRHQVRRNLVLLEIADSYFRLLQARQTLDALDNLRKLSDQVSEQLLVHVNAGLAYSSDWLLFQSGTRRIQSEMQEMLANEERHSIALSVLLGLDPETEWILEDSLSPPNQHPDSLPASLDQFVAQRPEFRAAETRIRDAQLAEKQLRQDRSFPQIEFQASSALFGRVGKDVEPVQTAQHPETHSLYPTTEINLSLSWQIPLGYLLRGNERKTLALQKKLTEDQLNTIEAGLRAEMHAAYRSVRLASQKYAFCSEAVNFAVEALEQASSRIALGVVRPMEHLQAMESTLVGQRNMLDALAKLNFETFRLKLALGTPFDSNFFRIE